MSGTRRIAVAVLGLAALMFIALALFRAGGRPAIGIEPEVPGIGKRTPVRVTLDEPGRGLSGVHVELVQGERVEPLVDRSYTPRPFWAFWGERTTHDELSLEVGSETVEGLAEGPATIRVVADRAGTWVRFPSPVVEELSLEVKLRPPALQVQSSFTYVSQGGCEAVVYSVGPSAVEDGVAAGKWWFPGHPLPGTTDGRRFALFAAPYDLDDPAGIRLVARDAVGNEARTPFVEKFFEKPVKKDRIRLSDRFMSRVVPAIMDRTPELRDAGNLLDNYLKINGDLRRENARFLAELATQSSPEFLWSRPFLPMRNAKVMSNFADRRTYVYDGRDVDEQDHLGFDLASTRGAEVQAANDGIVMLARYFGIYGNTVVIDHGYGLMTLYGHLSSIEVEPGQRVERGAAIGRSGETGLAGGDHLHFTVLLQGLPVDPREWWDGHWIHDRLKLKLASAMPFEG